MCTRSYCRTLENLRKLPIDISTAPEMKMIAAHRTNRARIELYDPHRIARCYFIPPKLRSPGLSSAAQDFRGVTVAKLYEVEISVAIIFASVRQEHRGDIQPAN